MLADTKGLKPLHIVRVNGDAGDIQTTLERLNHPVLVHADAHALRELTADPVVIVIDAPVDAAALRGLSGLGHRTAETLAVVRGLTARAEAELMAAGVDEIVDSDEATGPTMTRALNRARMRYMMRHDAQQARRIAYDLLDRMPLAVIFTRADAHIVHANARARSLMTARDVLVKTAEGTLAAAQTDDTHRLQDTIRNVARGGLDPEGALTIRPADEDSAPVSVIVVPAGATAGGAQGAALFVTAPDETIRIDEGRLAALYGLTRSEARILARLASGLTLEDIAAEGSQKVMTVRSQLKAVFQKTGTRRQSEAIKLVLSGPALIGLPGA
jgi:DNA-binding CsgD family transcriptional regulator